MSVLSTLVNTRRHLESLDISSFIINQQESNYVIFYLEFEKKAKKSLDRKCIDKCLSFI